MPADRHNLCRMPVARAAAIWAESRGVPRPSRATVNRWIVHGIGGIKLAAELFGGRWYCRPIDLVLFHANLRDRRASRSGGAA